MPLVRVSHSSRWPVTTGALIGEAVHRAMIETFNVPPDDRFQIITAHEPSHGLVGPRVFLGIPHSDDLAVIQITCAEGRTVQQKKVLYAAIADHVSRDAGIARADVIINLVETKRENWSFGDGLAPFAPD